METSSKTIDYVFLCFISFISYVVSDVQQSDSTTQYVMLCLTLCVVTVTAQGYYSTTDSTPVLCLSSSWPVHSITMPVPSTAL